MYVNIDKSEIHVFIKALRQYRDWCEKIKISLPEQSCLRQQCVEYMPIVDNLIKKLRKACIAGRS